MEENKIVLTFKDYKILDEFINENDEHKLIIMDYKNNIKRTLIKITE